MFNGGEVNYLTVKDNNKFHVFLNKEVVGVFANSVVVENSQARAKKQTPEQKVIFKYDNKNIAELEMRNDSKIHYRQIRFNMLKPRMMSLLYDKIALHSEFSDKIFVYGYTGKKIGNWKK